MVSPESSWKMFRGNVMRTGVSSSKLSRKPYLQWVMELGPLVASPVVDNGILYAATITGRIFAVHTYLGQIKWHWNVGSPIVSSPLLQEDLLISASFDSWIKEAGFVGKNQIFALNVNTGKPVWSFDAKGDIFSSPCSAHDLIIIGSMNQSLLALDIQGNFRWRFKTQGQIWSSPSFNGDNVFVGSDDGFLYCLDLDGKLHWRTKLNGKIRSSSPCLSEDKTMVFVGTHNGAMYCLNQFDGKIRWHKHITRPVLSSAALLKDRVYFASSDNKIYCFDCNSGSRIWEFGTNDRIWSSPALSEHDGVLFFGSLDSHIYGVDIRTGIQTWKFPTMNMLDSSPCIASNMLFMGGRDGLLYAFGTQKIS